MPTSPATKANYKNVTVTVFRARDWQAALDSRAPRSARASGLPFGGINKGIVNVTGAGLLRPNAPIPDVLVNLNNGPSSPLGDTTDAAGQSVPARSIRRPGSTLLRPRRAVRSTATSCCPIRVVTHFQLAAGRRRR